MMMTQRTSVRHLHAFDAEPARPRPQAACGAAGAPARHVLCAARDALVTGLLATLFAGLAQLAVAAPQAHAEQVALPAVDRMLNDGALRTRHGLALLDSDVLLKIYIAAYSGRPVDYSALLTANTENIDPPKPVQPTILQKQEIDNLVHAARQHPDVLIRVNDIALDAYDVRTRAFPIDNRIFITGGRYYFDNSPFYFAYQQPTPFRLLHCTDARTIAQLQRARADFVHFDMDITGHVTGTQGGGKGLSIAPRKVVLRDALGVPLLEQGDTP